MVDGTDPLIGIDFFSEGSERDGGGVYGDDLKLALVEDNNWTVLDVAAGATAKKSLSPLTWDAASWIDSVLDVGLTNSDIAVPLFLGTWADDVTNSSLNSAYPGNIVAIPEPATYGLITLFGGGLLLFRRRFKL